MTTTENEQRDELSDVLASAPANLTDYTDAPRETADTILPEGCRKPRTITTVEELDALPEGTRIIDADPEECIKVDGEWRSLCCGLLYESSEIALPATVPHGPEAVAGA